jgi:hypothetical protein
MLGGLAMSKSVVLGLTVIIDCVHAAMMSARFGGSAGSGLQHAQARLRALSIAYPRVRAIILSLC